MKTDTISRFFLCLTLLFVIFICCETAISGDAPQVTTDKDIYYGETIKVSYFNSPGKANDWICIVPAGSPDTVVGDYKYIPKRSSQGVLAFDPPAPGKYEVRAYYNYTRKKYVVSARHTFSVAGGANYEKTVAERPQPPPAINAVGNLPMEKVRPSIRITRMEIAPGKVKPGSKFDLKVQYTASDPSAERKTLTVRLTYAIYRQETLLFESAPIDVESINGGGTERKESINAAKSTGVYTMKVRLQYNDVVANDERAFTIE